MLANWPVILLRLGEAVLLAAVAVGLIMAILVPVLVSAGMSKIAWEDIDSAQEAILTFLTANALLFVWILIAISFALLVFVAVHSFVEAGAAQIFLDAERAAGPHPAFGHPLPAARGEGLGVRRTRFAAFSMERWMLGGRRGWWTAFWIYNIVWTIAGLILIIPLLLAIAVMLIIGDAMASIILGCFVLVIVMLMAIAIAIVTNALAVKAILDSLAYSLTARDALRMAWRELRTDLGRHAAVVGLLMVVAMAVAGIVSSASLGFSFSRSVSWTLLFAPVRLVLQFANTALSAAIANWMLGSFAALVSERRS